jgi:hypothetical protein
MHTNLILKIFPNLIYKLKRKHNELNVEEGGLRFKVLKEKEDYVNSLEQEIRTKTAKLKTYQIMPPVIIVKFYSFILLIY